MKNSKHYNQKLQKKNCMQYVPYTIERVEFDWESKYTRVWRHDAVK